MLSEQAFVKEGTRRLKKLRRELGETQAGLATRSARPDLKSVQEEEKKERRKLREVKQLCLQS